MGLAWQSADVVRFHAYEVHLRAGELYKAGRKIKLQAQPFQVLAMLLECPCEVVTREDLQKRLWPADTFVDFEQGRAQLRIPRFGLAAENGLGKRDAEFLRDQANGFGKRDVLDLLDEVEDIT